METAAPAPLPTLPEDAIAAILCLLSAPTIAASRCVCKAWRALVDAHRLLAAHLLPRSVRRLFINYGDKDNEPRFLARPTAATPGAPRIDGEFDYIPRKRPGNWHRVGDHCNGLVLYRDEVEYGRYFEDDEPYPYERLHVCNPMTRRSARLPLLRVRQTWRRRAFLVFDPAVSLHYEVFLAPLEPAEDTAVAASGLPEDGGAWRLMEWPPSLWTWHVFSSRTGRWEERVFAREGEAAGTFPELMMGSLKPIPQARWRYAVYWQGALYVHCRGEYISRLSFLDDTYRVIKSPIDRAECYDDVQSFLGRSEKGIYFAAIDRCHLRVWILNEGYDGAEWIPKHDSVVKPHEWWKVFVICHERHRECRGPWILDDYYDGIAEDNSLLLKNVLRYGREKKDNTEDKSNNHVEWSSDDDDVIDSAGLAESGIEDYFVMFGGPFGPYQHPKCFTFLGFHPYKEVIFLSTVRVGVAYHLNNSKVQFLGVVSPGGWYSDVYESFVYAPCIRPA
ncbi:unnamed protein product [Urochloa decumbens]|uniref:F-box domain-containing protein n=1 Tax=Urochloa decumbens TaxID=240449 RepID=A0ABC9E316_9POAL